VDIHSIQHNMSSVAGGVRGRELGLEPGPEPVDEPEFGFEFEPRGLLVERIRIPPVLTAEQARAIHTLKPFLKAIADVNRLGILQELAREGSSGLSVLELSERLNLSQPLTSWHLLILKRARLVSPTRAGRQHIYRLNQQRLNEYRELFNRVMPEPEHR
jgi:DNA-binding transcriptional ArsR family regulator